MISGKIVVLGATGNVGTPLVSELMRRGAPVRAAVRGIPEASRAGNVEFVEFDYFDSKTYSKVFDGAHALYLLTPVMPDPAKLTAELVDAAKSAGVQRIVKQSAYGAETTEKVQFLNWHREAEEIVASSGLAYVLLRPTGFYQNYLSYAEDIASNGVFYLPMGSDRSSYVDARDVASVAAEVLLDPGLNARKIEVTGPESLSNEDIADILSSVTGNQIKFVPVSDFQAREGLRQEGAPDWLAEGLVELMRYWRGERAAKIVNTVAHITDHAAIRFEDFAREHVQRFKRRAAA